MDVLPSELYSGERYDSDDSLPDVAQAFGLKTRYKKRKKTPPSVTRNRAGYRDRILVSSQETMMRMNRDIAEYTPSDTLSQAKQYVERDISRVVEDTLTGVDHVAIGNRKNGAPAPSRIEIDLDPISSSSPFPSLPRVKATPNRTKSFNSVEPILSSSPLPAVQPIRTPLRRASTFHSIDPVTPSLIRQLPRFNQTNAFHEISDEDDDDLKAAIAASLAGFQSPVPKPAPVVPSKPSTSAFQCPDVVFRSSPPSSQASLTLQEVIQPRPSPPVQPVTHATPPSSHVREDTRQMLAALDDLTTNILKRKPVAEEAPPPTKKKSTKAAGTENTDNSKARKRGPLTQEEKVTFISELTDKRSRAPLFKQKNKPPRKLNVWRRLIHFLYKLIRQEAKQAEKAEKQQVEALNRLKTRKEACPDLMAYIPPTLPEALHNHILNFLEPLGIDTREWIPSTPDAIKFVRKVNAEWDEEGMLFRPCEEYRRDEEWIIHWLKADKFVEMTCLDQTGLALKFHMEKLKSAIQGAKPIIVLEGLSGLLARAKTARNRAHDAAVRARLGGEQTRSKKDTQLLELNEEVVENALIEIQLVHEIRVVQTSSAPDSAEWISILAADIASIPYKYIPCQTSLTVDGAGCSWIDHFVWNLDRLNLVLLLKTHFLRCCNKFIE